MKKLKSGTVTKTVSCEFTLFKVMNFLQISQVPPLEPTSSH